MTNQEKQLELLNGLYSVIERIDAENCCPESIRAQLVAVVVNAEKPRNEPPCIDCNRPINLDLGSHIITPVGIICEGCE